MHSRRPMGAIRLTTSFLNEVGGEDGDPVRAGSAISRSKTRTESSIGVVIAIGGARLTLAWTEESKRYDQQAGRQKYGEVVCCERHRSNSKRWRCFTGDEGWPLEVGLQEQASNRHELHGLRASVVNVDGKGGAGLRQVRFKETNESEPLMTCRNVLNGVETGTRTSVPRLKVERYLFTAQPASGMKAA